MIQRRITIMKELISVALALVIALSLCLPVYAEGGVQKYGDIGRLSKLNIAEAILMP
jgi:hypothetical protein